VPSRLANADRIARAAEEAEAAQADKAEKKATAKKPSAKRSRASRAAKTPQRMKIVWVVGKPGQTPHAVYPYAERAEADAEAQRLGEQFIVLKAKVPMED